MALDFLKKGNDAEAAKHFQNVYSVMKESTLSEDAIASAGSIYLRTGNKSGFRAILDIMNTSYPSGKASFSLLMEAGKTFEEKGANEEAADMFEKAATHAGGGAEERRKLLLKTADMLAKAGKPDRLTTLIDSGTEAGHIIDRGQTRVPLQARHGRGPPPATRDKAYSTLKALSKDKLDPFHAAKAAFAASNMKLDEYLETKIKDPVTASFEKKESKMKELLAGYGAAIKSGYAEFMASSFYNMGMVLEDFKDSLLSSSRPSDLSDDELKEYDYLLEEKVYPLEEEAIRSYRGSLKASFEHGELQSNGYGEKALSKLAVLKPALYKKGHPVERVRCHRPPAEPYAKEESKEFFSLLNSANLYHTRKELSGALWLYKKAETIIPEDPYLNYNMGILLMKNKDQASVEKLGKSLTLKDANPEVLEAYAYSIFLFNDVKDALAFYEDLRKPERASLAAQKLGHNIRNLLLRTTQERSNGTRPTWRGRGQRRRSNGTMDSAHRGETAEKLPLYKGAGTHAKRRGSGGLMKNLRFIFIAIFVLMILLAPGRSLAIEAADEKNAVKWNG